MMRRFVSLVVGLLAVALTPDTGHAAITEIIDLTGDGAGNGLSEPRVVATDASGNVYLTGFPSDNAFKITPGGAIT
jgi:hypothetical protein